jgi:hypothetical protein
LKYFIFWRIIRNSRKTDAQEIVTGDLIGGDVEKRAAGVQAGKPRAGLRRRGY